MTNEPKNNGGPAFPRPMGEHGPDFLGDPRKYNDSQKGMTLRDYFAGQALIGILSNPALTAALGRHAEEEKYSPFIYCADVCGNYADAMLKEREK